MDTNENLDYQAYPSDSNANNQEHDLVLDSGLALDSTLATLFPSPENFASSLFTLDKYQTEILRNFIISNKLSSFQLMQLDMSKEEYIILFKDDMHVYRAFYNEFISNKRVFATPKKSQNNNNLLKVTGNKHFSHEFSTRTWPSDIDFEKIDDKTITWPSKLQINAINRCISPVNSLIVNYLVMRCRQIKVSYPSLSKATPKANEKTIQRITWNNKKIIRYSDFCTMIENNWDEFMQSMRESAMRNSHYPTESSATSLPDCYAVQSLDPEQINNIFFNPSFVNIPDEPQETLHMPHINSNSPPNDPILIGNSSLSIFSPKRQKKSLSQLGNPETIEEILAKFDR